MKISRRQIRKILIHPLASVLSACGIGKAQIRNIQKKNLSIKASSNWKEKIEKFYFEIENEAKKALLSQGVHPSEIILQRKITLKYEVENDNK